MRGDDSRNDLPLSGLKVLDFSKNLPGPYAGLLLSNLGAEVIKIEHTKAPDPLVHYPPYKDEKSLYYAVLNDAKKILRIDFIEEYDRLTSLIENADVLISSARNGVMHKMNLGYNNLCLNNPRLIYVDIFGYSQDNNYSTKAGHDLNFQALSGLLYKHIINQKMPAPLPYQYADIFGGSTYALEHIYLALYQRERTGRGQYLSVDMLSGIKRLGVLEYANNQVEADELTLQWFDSLSGGLCNYNVYKCADDNYMALGALEPKFWSAFCAWAGHHEWLSFPLEGREGNEVGKQLISAFFQGKTMAEWTALCSETDFCLTPVIRPWEIDL